MFFCGRIGKRGNFIRIFNIHIDEEIIRRLKEIFYGMDLYFINCTTDTIELSVDYFSPHTTETEHIDKEIITRDWLYELKINSEYTVVGCLYGSNNNWFKYRISMSETQWYMFQKHKEQLFFLMELTGWKRPEYGSRLLALLGRLKVLCNRPLCP